MRPPDTVVREAERLWSLDIRDTARSPASMAQIDRIIRDRDCLGWWWAKEYKRNKQFKWCAAFVAACWRTAGLHPALASAFFSSCYRLDRWSQYKGFGPFKFTHMSVGVGRFRERGLIADVHERMGGKRLRICADHKCRSVDGLIAIHKYAPQPGDIATVGNGKPYGTHCVLITGADANSIFTIEGNAHGITPGASWTEGAIKRSRPISTIARIYRPAPLDLCEGARYFTP